MREGLVETQGRTQHTGHLLCQPLRHATCISRSSPAGLIATAAHVPAAHVSQAVCPVCAWKLPAPQSVGEVRPVVGHL